MSAKLKKNSLIVIPVCIFAIFDSAFTSFAPVLAKISEVFPEQSTTSIQMILAMPALTLIPASLVSGFLASYLYKKTIAQIALSIMCFGGLLPLFFHNSINILFLSSALIGLGQGFIKPLASSLICEYFDSKEKGTVLGIKQSANYLGAALLTVIVGLLSMISWYSAYWVYITLIPIIVLTGMLLPKGKLEDRIFYHEAGIKGLKSLFNTSFIIMILICFLSSTFSFAFYTNLAMIIAEKQLGGSISAAIISTINSVLSFITGLSFGFILKILRSYTRFFSFIIVALSFVVFLTSGSIAFLLVAAGMFGIGNGIQEIANIFYVSESAPKHMATMAMAVAMGFISLGVVLSAPITNLLRELLFNSMSVNLNLVVSCIGYTVLIVIEVVLKTVYGSQSKI